jgi:hypothetical protein
MVTQELVNAATQERMREAARLQLEKRVRAAKGQVTSPRRAPSRPRIRRLSLPSFVACVFRSAPTS